jgi:hypothetical protein
MLTPPLSIGNCLLLDVDALARGGNSGEMMAPATTADAAAAAAAGRRGNLFVAERVDGAR